MAFFETNLVRGAGIADNLSGFAARISDYLTRRAVYRRTISELRGMSNRDLADIGLNRSMIISVAHEAAWGK